MTCSSASSSPPMRSRPRARSSWPSSPTCWGTSWSRCRTTRTRPSTSTPGRCSPPSPPVRRRCGSPRTSPTCPSARRRCSPRPWRPSTSSATAAPSSAWVPGRSGTRSSPWAARVAPPARRSRRSRKASRSSAAPGAWTATGPSTSTVTSTGSRGCTPARVPVHDVQIWLGALKPRMLRLTGRLADGWLPSLGYVTPDNMGEMNAVIDEAADRAGRGPQAVRRMLNIFGGHEYLQGGSAVMAERLAALTLEHGTSTFILGSDDPDELRRFAAEVDPRRPRPRRRRATVIRWSRCEERQRRVPSETTHPDATPPHADRGRRHPPVRVAALGRDHPPVVRRPGRRRSGVPAGRRPPAPRRHPRPPAGGAGPGTRHRRPGPPRPADRRRRPVGDQHDDDAPEQLDARGVLRVVLPHRHRPPHARGPQRLHPPAPPRPRPRRRARPAVGGARGHPRRARAGRRRAGRPGRRPVVRRRRHRRPRRAAARPRPAHRHPALPPRLRGAGADPVPWRGTGSARHRFVSGFMPVSPAQPR